MADFHFVYNEREYVVDDFYFEYLIQHGIKEDRVADLLGYSLNHQINITKKYIEKLNDAEHRGKAESFIEKYRYVGFLKFPYTEDSPNKTKLEDQFRQDDRFRGRIPGIIDSIASVYDFYKKYDKECDLVNKFNLNAVRNMIRSNIPGVQTVLLYERYSPDKCLQLAANNKYVEDICSLLVKGTKKNNIAYLQAADWITEHLETDERIIERIVKNAEQFHINENLTVDGIKAQFANLKAFKEKDKVEKAYKKPGFKLSECTCELKDVQKEVLDGRLMAYIMHPQDERQLILGYVTNCCQKLGDAGESSMMHGLLNPKAGFFVIQDQNTGEIKAQAEIWEENENTLVFDNIEYANDCDISLYKGILGKWLSETSYYNVKMGVGYNGLIDEFNFRSCGRVTPTITAREAYVMSYEDEIEIPDGREELECLESEEEAQRLIDTGEITYYTYLYCDSENEAVWLKESNIIEEYFRPENPLSNEIRSAHSKIADLLDDLNCYEISKIKIALTYSDIYLNFINNRMAIEQYQMTNMPVFTGVITDKNDDYIDGVTISYTDLQRILSNDSEITYQNFENYLNAKMEKYIPISITIENDMYDIELEIDF